MIHVSKAEGMEQESNRETKQTEPLEVTFEGSRMMLVMVVMIIPFYLLGNFLFNTIWKGEAGLISLDIPTWAKYAAVIAAIFIHELIHGIIFAIYAPGGFRAVRFGFSKAMGSPYCHCKEPILVKHYRRAGIAPLIILGVIPLALAMFTGVSWLKTFGLLLCIGGFGDLLVWIRLLKFDGHLMVRDHPKSMGFIIDQFPSQ